MASLKISRSDTAPDGREGVIVRRLKGVLRDPLMLVLAVMGISTLVAPILNSVLSASRDDNLIMLGCTIGLALGAAVAAAFVVARAIKRERAVVRGPAVDEGCGRELRS